MEVREGYKQTEVGVIPEDWECATLGDICKYQNGTALEKYFNHDDGYKVISIGNYSSNGRFVETETFIDRSYKTEIRKFLLDKNDLTMLLNDKTSIGMIIGRVLLIEFDESYVFNQRTMRLKTKEKIIPRFLFFLINCDYIHGTIVGLAKPGTQIYVNTDDITGLKLPIPPTKTEQTAIANALSDTDVWIQSLTRLIAKKRQIKQGAMQALLNPYGNGRLKEGWVVKKLGDVAEFINGRAYNISEWETHGVPVIRLQNLTGRGENYYYSNLELPRKQYCVKGDLLFMWSATFGPVIWKGKTAIYHYHIWKIQCRSFETNKKYLFYLLDNLTAKLKKSSSSGGTMLHVTKEKMESTKVTLPIVTEQTRIATILSDIDNEITALETKLAKAKTIKQGMMQNLLTGRIRLI